MITMGLRFQSIERWTVYSPFFWCVAICREFVAFHTMKMQIEIVRFLWVVSANISKVIAKVNATKIIDQNYGKTKKSYTKYLLRVHSNFHSIQM